MLKIHFTHSVSSRDRHSSAAEGAMAGRGGEKQEHDGWAVGNREDKESRSKKLAGRKYRHQEGAISRWGYGQDGREGNCGSYGTSHISIFNEAAL